MVDGNADFVPPWAVELFKKIDSSNMTLQEMKQQNDEIKRQNERYVAELKQQNDEMKQALYNIEQKTGEKGFGDFTYREIGKSPLLHINSSQ